MKCSIGSDFAATVLQTCLLLITAPIWGPMLLFAMSMSALGPATTQAWHRVKRIASEKYQDARWSAARSLRRLHLSLKTRTKRRQIRQIKQSSLLVSLPLELKLKIWGMVYEDMTIHMCSHGKQVRHFVCPEQPALRTGDLLDGPCYVQCSCFGSALEPAFSTPPNALAVKDRREKEPAGMRHLRIPGLHLTCRAM